MHSKSNSLLTYFILPYLDTGYRSSHTMLRPTADHQFSFVHLSPSKPISQFIPNVQGMFYQCSPLKTEARCVFGIIFIRYTHNRNNGKPYNLKFWKQLSQRARDTEITHEYNRTVLFEIRREQ